MGNEPSAAKTSGGRTRGASTNDYGSPNADRKSKDGNDGYGGKERKVVITRKPSDEAVHDRILHAGTKLKAALVICNAKYQNFERLEKSTNDGNDIAKKLELIGFEVALHVDTTRSEMVRAMRRFQRLLESGPAENTTAFVSYHGHAIQADGNNYLLGIDADIDSVDEVKEEGVLLSQVLSTLVNAGHSGPNVIVLDCCRDNPFHHTKVSGASTTGASTATRSVIASPRSTPSGTSGSGGGAGAGGMMNGLAAEGVPGERRSA
eukprot:GFYU01008466.1.p1 GENE.GFYU01008466.1~~GFYU01008466.1.p1  ORF type:complete len:263 (-),score=29.96 GFYU01008466.1:14-802(-)